jgi:hypothetical protein
MYRGVTEDWVQNQITGRLTSTREFLNPLVAENFRPAVGIIRLSE